MDQILERLTALEVHNTDELQAIRAIVRDCKIETHSDPITEWARAKKLADMGLTISISPALFNLMYAALLENIEK